VLGEDLRDAIFGHPCLVAVAHAVRVQAVPCAGGGRRPAEEHVLPAAAVLGRTGASLPGLGFDLPFQEVSQERR